MNKRLKILQFVWIVVLAFIIYARPAFAAGAVKISADKSSCAVGDTVKITVSADNPSNASVAPEISVTYDIRRLEFKDCSTSYGGGGGGLISLTDTNADITFTVLSGGIALVDVSAVFDGDGADVKTADVSIEVEGEDVAAINDSDAPVDLGIEGGSISSGSGDKLVSAVFADEFMPMGFYKTSITYEEQLVEAAQFDMGNILLLYVTDEYGNNGNFNVYNPDTGELSDFLQISGIENRFIIALRASDADVKPPEGFTLATLKWNEQTLDAYSYDGLNDFFLLYAVSSEGNRGWYLYDQNEGTYQRFVNELYSGKTTDNSSEINGESADTDMDTDGINEKESSKTANPDIKLILIIALTAVVLGLLTAVVIMAVKLKDYGSYEYIDEDEYMINPITTNKPYDKPENKFENKLENKPENKPEKKLENKPENRLAAGGLAERETGSGNTNPEMKKPENIYEKYRSMDEQKQNTAIQTSAPSEKINDTKKDDYENDLYEDEEGMSKEDRKALKAEEKARKKAEKKMKKEYGEFGPADFNTWQEAVRDDRKVKEDDLNAAKAKITENKEVTAKEKLTAEKTDPVTDQIKKQSKNLKNSKNTEQDDIKKDSYVKMLKSLPANDTNEPVQPKPVQQFDLDDDFEFEYLSIDDD